MRYEIIHLDRALPSRRQGSFSFQAPVARTGEHYYGAGERGTLPPGFERRDMLELRNIADQLAGIPVVILHPNGLMADNPTKKVVGEVSRGWVEGGFAVADIRIHDKEGLDAIDNGVKELSLGYSTELDSSGYQRNSRVDHLALVEMSRCGSSCTIRSDCSATCSCQTGKVQRKEIRLSNQILAARFNHGR